MKRSLLKVSVLVVALVISMAGAALVKGGPVAEAPVSPSSQEFEVTIYAHEDAYIEEDNYNDNNGGATTLVIGYTGTANRDILLKFDLSALPPDAVVESATLQLSFVYNAASGALDVQQTCDIFPYVNSGSWQETVVTWNNAPGYSYNFDPSADALGPGSFVEWDVTNSVDDWVRGVLTNYGFRLAGDRATQCIVGFQSREYGISDPQLEIVYTSPSSTATPTPTATKTPTPTTTPTPSGSGSCPGTVYVYPDHDTYVNAENPEAEYGNQDFLSIRRDLADPQGNQRNLLLHFPIDALISPGYYIYEAKLKLNWFWWDGTAPESWWTAGAYDLEDSFDETTANWNNQPERGSLYDAFSVWPEGETVHTADVTELVREWYTGAKPNYGIGIMPSVPVSGAYQVHYRSKEYGGLGASPALVIECGEDPPTPTPTPTSTKTPTPTPTPTITPTPVPETADVYPYKLEVTQGLQVRDHSIPLLEGKRTYVRVRYTFKDPVPGYIYNATAELDIYRNGWDWQASVLPITTPSGYIELVEQTWWSVYGHSFIFELPSEYTSGEIRLKARIDPGWELPESNRFNNSIERTVSFGPAHEYNLHVFLVKHIAEDGTITQANLMDFLPSWDYAKAALPFADVNTVFHTLDFYEASLGEMTCDSVNHELFMRWYADSADPETDIYYGFAPGWIRGCSAGIPATLATSSVNDWRGTVAHELGHCFGRHHTQNPEYDDAGDAWDIGCGAGTGCYYSSFWWGYTDCPDGFEEYPYDEGSISPEPGKVLGFYHNGFLEPPGATWPHQFYIPDRTWKDLMTYCNPEIWPSDFTWENIYEEHFKIYGQAAVGLDETARNEAVDSLVAVGTIYSDTGVVELQPLFVLPGVTWAPEPNPGEFAIVLRDAASAELLRHEFTPGLVDVEDFGNVLSIGELVPYVDGTARVDIEGPTGVLASVTSGPSAPRVTVVRPNGGETLSGRTALVSWTANDPDGDPLSFNVQYSADDGVTWSLVASNVLSTSVTIDTDNMPSSRRGRIRVLASDGIHTAYDSSDRAFTVPNHRPSVEILAPQVGDTYIVSQTVGLEAQVYDVEEGSLEPGRVRWGSNLDGVVGHGAQVSLADLTPGRHTITLEAVDSEGASNSDSVRIEVLAGADDLPPMADMLQAEPALVVLNPRMGIDSQQIYVYNYTNPDPIAWTAEASEPWVQLSATRGSTPDSLTVSADTASLPNGRYTAVVTFTEVGNREDTTTINLSVTVRNFSVYLPLVLKTES